MLFNIYVFDRKRYSCAWPDLLYHHGLRQHCRSDLPEARSGY